MAFIFKNDTSKKIIYNEDMGYNEGLPDLVDRKNFGHYLSNMVPTNANVAARIGDKKQTCSPLSGPTECKEFKDPNLHGCADYN